MTQVEKRKLRQKIQTKITALVTDDTYIHNDEEYALALFYASQEIGMMLARLDDIFDEDCIDKLKQW